MVRKKEAPLHAVKRSERVGFAFWLAMSPESLLLFFMGFLALYLFSKWGFHFKPVTLVPLRMAMPTFPHLLLFKEVFCCWLQKKYNDICIIWGCQKEGMFCSTCGKIFLHLMADRKCTRQRSCLPTHCGQGEFRCPQPKQLSKVHFCCLSVSISYFSSIYGQMCLSPRFSYLGEGSVPLMSLTSKQGFAPEYRW